MVREVGAAGLADDGGRGGLVDDGERLDPAQLGVAEPDGDDFRQRARRPRSAHRARPPSAS
jgi:hypothetical protein